MIIDGRGVADGTRVETDVCIIGSGPAGLTLARKLGRLTSARVTVVESGGIRHHDSAQALAAGSVEGRSYFPLHESRVRRVGGTTWSWGGVLATLDPIDFETRDWVADSGWPIPYRDVARHYPEAFGMLGVAPEDSGLAADHGSDADSVEPGEVRFVRPTRFGPEFAPEFEHSRRLDLYTHASVVSLVPSGRDGRVSGAEVRCLDGTRWEIGAATFVLAGGGIENPRLLMLTNRKYGRGIGDESDWLGRGFMEHPRIKDRLWVEGGIGALDPLVMGAAGTLRFGRVRLTEATQRRERLLNYLANLSYGYAGQDAAGWTAVRRLAIAVRRPWRESPFFQDAGGGPMGIRAADVRTVLSHPVDSSRAVVGAALKPARLRRFVEIGSSVEQAPHSSNRVALANGQVDALGQPRAILHWTVGEAEARTYERGLALVVDHLRARLPGTARVFLERSQWDRDLLGTWHHMGTTRMSERPDGGVVDRNLRVHGADNVYVTGSSVFPTGGAAAPTVTIMALSLRLAEHLAKVVASATVT